jgi:hypothetical protein
MPKTVLDTKELLGYRLLSEEEISSAAVTAVKAGGKVGQKRGNKPAVEKPAP